MPRQKNMPNQVAQQNQQQQQLQQNSLMDIGDNLERYPELEEICREQIINKYTEMLGNEPMKELLDYVIMIGVKNNSSRAETFTNFQVLFKENTEELVKWLFDSLAPQIRQETAKKDKDSKQSQR
jgi:uncharacterized protein YjgD (DUF1641 family)